MANQDMQERKTYTSAFAITKSDATVLPPTWGGLFVGGAGAVTVTTLDGELVTFTGVLAGSWLPIVVTKVMAATVATNIVGMR
jgi:hypothetical protein